MNPDYLKKDRVTKDNVFIHKGEEFIVGDTIRINYPQRTLGLKNFVGRIIFIGCNLEFIVVRSGDEEYRMPIVSEYERTIESAYMSFEKYVKPVASCEMPF